MTLEKSKVEKHLESILFDKENEDFDEFLNENKDLDQFQDAEDELSPQQFFIIDSFGENNADKSQARDAEEIPDEDVEMKTGDEVECVWYDEDDENVMIDLKKETRFKKLRVDYEEEIITGVEYQKRVAKLLFKQPEWAKRVYAGVEDKLNALLNTSTPKIKQGTLIPDVIDIRRVKDANCSETSSCVIQSLQFHKNGQVMLTAGMDKTLRLFQIDGLTNSKIQSVHIDDLPISCAQFTADGKEIVLSGLRRHFYFYNIEGGSVEKVPFINGRDDKALNTFAVSPCNRFLAFPGKAGHILFLSRSTKQLIFDLKMNGHVKSLCFSHDGSFLYSFGGDGFVYQWDTTAGACVHVFKDEGTLKGSCVSLSSCGKYIACGSDSGCVNLYELEEALSKKNPKPLKTFMNLTTYIDGIEFHPSSQLMLIFSRSKQNCLRLIHVPSLRVYSNWPTLTTPLRYVQTAAFSPSGEFIAIGNDKGEALLYMLGAFMNSNQS